MTSMIFFSTDSRLFSKMCLFLQVKNMGGGFQVSEAERSSIPTIWVNLPWSHNHWLFSPSFLCTSPIRKENVNTFNSWWNFLLFLLPTGNRKTHSNFTFLSQLSSSTFIQLFTNLQLSDKFYKIQHSNITHSLDKIFIQIHHHMRRFQK